MPFENNYPGQGYLPGIMCHYDPLQTVFILSGQHPELLPVHVADVVVNCVVIAGIETAGQILVVCDRVVTYI